MSTVTFCPFCGGFGVILIDFISNLVLSSGAPSVNKKSLLSYYTFLLQSDHILSLKDKVAKARKKAEIMMAFISFTKQIEFPPSTSCNM